MNRLILIVFLVIGCTMVKAQTQDTTWLNIFFEPLDSATQTIHFYRILEDSAEYIIVNDYYLNHKQQCHEVFKGEIDSDNREGYFHYYHDNGRKSAQGRHVAGKHEGWWQYYFRSGQLSAEVKFAAGEIVEEKYINEDGTSATREEAFEQPKFPGGDAAMFAFVDERLVYPEAARENGIEGLVVARLIILEDGSVGGAKIIRPLISVCDQVTLDIALQMPDFSVGKQFNRPARVYMNMPLRFNLTPSGKPEESESDN